MLIPDQPNQDIKQAFCQLVKPANACIIYEGTDEPVGFQVVDGNTAQQFLIHGGHRDNIHTALLGIQNSLEGTPCISPVMAITISVIAFCLDDFEQMVISSQNGKSFQVLPDFLRVIIHETDQEEWLGTQLVIHLRKRLSSFASPDDQYPAQECLGSENLDIDQPPDQSKHGGKKQENANPKRGKEPLGEMR